MTSLRDVLDELGIPSVGPGEHEHARHGWLQIDCPLCSPDGKRFRLGITLDGRHASCWSCGPKYVIRACADASGKDFGAVARAFRGMGDAIGVERPQASGKLKLPIFLTPLEESNPHLNYLIKRGFSGLDFASVMQMFKPQCIRNVGLVKDKTSGKSIDLSWRIFIPIKDVDGETVSWTTRSIKEGHAFRYRSAPKSCEKYDHKTMLYGHEFCGHNVIVHEGPLDVWKTGPGSVATFGTAFTRAQVLKLARFPKRAVCFDNTPEGIQKGEELCDQLKAFDGDTFKVVLDAKDAGSASSKEIRRLRRAFL